MITVKNREKVPKAVMLKTFRKMKHYVDQTGLKTPNKQVSRFVMPNEVYRPINVSELNASGESVNRNDIYNATSKNSCTTGSLKPKPQIASFHAQNSPIPLNIYHQNIRGLRGKPK